MQSREKILAAAAAGLVVLLGASWGVGTVRGWYQAKETQLDVLDRKVQALQLSIRKGEKAKRVLTELEARSLPSVPELALAQYQRRLGEWVEQAKFSNPSVEAGRLVPIWYSKAGKRELAYQVLPFSVRGKTSLEPLVRFLHAFYQAPHLHQVRRMSIKPLDGGGLDLILNIEAVILPTADRTDKLSTAAVARLERPTLDEYRRSIVDRNLFAPYSPPPPPRRDPPPIVRRPDPPPAAPPPPSFDAAKYTMITAILQAGGTWQVWLLNRTSGELLRLSQGQTLKVGDFRAVVGEFTADGVWIEAEGKRRLLTVGKSLREGFSPADERF